MALMNCPECGKEISDKAVSCPSCGCPINQQSSNSDEEYLCCPKCHSKELHSEHKGFSGGKALAGVILTGGIGLLAGTIGSKNVQITCLKCGKKFKAGEAIVVKNSEVKDEELERILATQGLVHGIKYYKDKSGLDLIDSKKYVDDYIYNNGITPFKPQGGCAGVILLFILLAGSMLAFI